MIEERVIDDGSSRGKFVVETWGAPYSFQGTIIRKKGLLGYLFGDRYEIECVSERGAVVFKQGGGISDIGMLYSVGPGTFKRLRESKSKRKVFETFYKLAA
jgi:hypothetical protein